MIAPALAADQVVGESDPLPEATVVSPSVVTTAEDNIVFQPLNELPYTDSYMVGDSADHATTVRVFNYPSGYRGPITLNIIGYDSSKYRARVMIYTPAGLLTRDDDYFGNSNFKVINNGGENAIQAIFIGISPRPALFFQAPWRQFEVRVSW